jgi:hypothetical protein
MTPKLKQYLNRTVLVSIPSVFKHGRCHPYTLRAIEEGGLWLTSEELLDRLYPDREGTDAARHPLVYVPNAQIAALILPVMPAATTPQSPDPTQGAPPEAGKPTSTTTA